MNDEIRHITLLFVRRLRGEVLSSAEEQALADWMVVEAHRHDLNELLSSESLFKAELRTRLSENYEANYQKIRAAIGAWDGTRVETGKPLTPVHRVHFLRRGWFKYAAAIFIIAGLAYLWNTQQKEKPAETVQTQPVPAKDIAPGGQKAVLTLASGSTITLDSAANGQLAEENGSKVTKKDGLVIYDAKGAQAQLTAVTYNTLSTPKGGQYEVRLPDGTHAWLNAASSITYPTAFTGSERRVKITGEVFFRVTKQSGKAFIVETRQDAIVVTGTQFNVNTYEDEGDVRTSLVEGIVTVKGKRLQPGQAYSNGKIVKANIQQDVAWKNGFFQFENADLRTVMRQLARWYDIEVEYKGVISPRRFEGKLPRTLTLQQVLRLLKNMNVDFELTGHRLTVR